MATTEELLIEIRDALYLIMSKDGYYKQKITAEKEAEIYKPDVVKIEK